MLGSVMLFMMLVLWVVEFVDEFFWKLDILFSFWNVFSFIMLLKLRWFCVGLLILIFFVLYKLFRVIFFGRFFNRFFWDLFFVLYKNIIFIWGGIIWYDLLNIVKDVYF